VDDTGSGRQRSVDEHFAVRAAEWKDIYGAADDVNAVVHQERLTAALAWVDRLALPTGSKVLDAGCGAGVAVVALAERGFQVDAVDTVPAMVEETARAAERAGMSERVAARTGDAHALDFPNGHFDLVMALGVFPFLHSPELAAREMARVLKPGGWLIANADNRRRMIRLLDPMQMRSLAPVRRALGSREGVPARMHTMRAFDEVLEGAGLRKVAARSVGYGPFTFMRRPMLRDERGRRLHAWLQQRADRGNALVRSMGAQYLVLARLQDAPA
jgi:ubiquinone/menaquinone biosynthesis C-methylase UbiE